MQILAVQDLSKTKHSQKQDNNTDPWSAISCKMIHLLVGSHLIIKVRKRHFTFQFQKYMC